MSEKILVLANSSGGLYSFRRELLSALSKYGALHASVPNNGRFPELEELGCLMIETPIDRRGINPVKDAGLLLRYWKLLRKEKPGLVITYTVKPNIYGGLVCRLLGIPYAANITGLGTAFQKSGMLRTVVTLLYRMALKKATTVFFENAGNMQTLLDEQIVRREQCCLLNGAGVNLEHYSLTPYPEDSEEIRFLFMGRVMKEKGIDELFAAMEQLHREGFRCSLDVLGGYEEDYSEKIAAGEAAGWLRYHGYQADVRPFIADAHCFVLPSWHEGMANTNLESAAMGRPVITSNIHGCMEAVIDGESGLLCQPGNADSLYEAMKTFLALRHEEKAAMGRRGREHMQDQFDKRIIVAKTIVGLGL